MATSSRLDVHNPASPRVVIIGAGPAGTRCAETLLAAGIKPILIDENRRDGGQIYRRQPEGFKRDYSALYGTEAAKRATCTRASTACATRSTIALIRWPGTSRRANCVAPARACTA